MRACVFLVVPVAVPTARRGERFKRKKRRGRRDLSEREREERYISEKGARGGGRESRREREPLIGANNPVRYVDPPRWSSTVKTRGRQAAERKRDTGCPVFFGSSGVTYDREKSASSSIHIGDQDRGRRASRVQFSRCFFLFVFFFVLMHTRRSRRRTNATRRERRRGEDLLADRRESGAISGSCVLLLAPRLELTGC